jgi:uncharacterized iron-regulated membrane protein
LHSQSLNDENSTASRLGISALETPATVQVITGESIRLRGDHADRTQQPYNGIPLINGELDERLRDVNYASGDSTKPFKDQRLHVTADWRPSHHDGKAFGFFGRVIVAVLSLLPVVLFVTGVMRWWQKRVARLKVERRAARQVESFNSRSNKVTAS